MYILPFVEQMYDIINSYHIVSTKEKFNFGGELRDTVYNIFLKYSVCVYVYLNGRTEADN